MTDLIHSDVLSGLSNLPSAGLLDFIAESAGGWREKPGRCGHDRIELREPDDEVTLTGPLDLNLTVYAEHAMERGGKTVLGARQPMMTHDVSIPAGARWTYGVGALAGLGGNAGASVLIRPTQPRPARVQVAQVADLPCDWAVHDIRDTGTFFPSPCEPCEGGPVRVPPLECGPALDTVPAHGGCVRPRYFTGMFITREDMETALRYVRLKLRMHNRAAGSGVVWGLDVALRGDDVVVGAGYGVDACGNDLTVTCDYVVPARSLLTDPAICRDRGHCYALLLEYVECPQDPRPVHGDGCEPSRGGCEMSRIRETVRLRLVRPRQLPASPLVRFLERVDGLLSAGRGEVEAVVSVEGPVPAPATIAVPFTVSTRAGQAQTQIQPSRTSVESEVIDPVGERGLFEVRIVPHSGAVSLSGAVTTRAGNPETTLTPTGAQWTGAWDLKPVSVGYVVDWRTGGVEPLEGRTEITVDVEAGESVDGVVRDFGGNRAFMEFPEDHGIQPGDEVQVEELPGSGRFRTFKVVEVGTLVVAEGDTADARPGGIARVGRPWRLRTTVAPTRVLVRPAPRRSVCCEGSCCDPKSRPLADRLRALLAALLYGQVAQQGSMATDPALRDRILGRLAASLGVDPGRLPEFEDAVADLYRAWCAGAVYPGPEVPDPDGVVIGCATVDAGAICAVDPLGGRRFVVHQPLLDYWGARFGLEPLDRRVSELFRRLCCLSHLPGFGDFAGAPRPTRPDLPLVADLAAIFPAPGFPSAPEATGAAGPAVAAAGAESTALLRVLAQVQDLDLPTIALIVDRLLCARPERPTPVPRLPDLVRGVVAAAHADLATSAQPRQPLREAARAVTAAVLGAIPVSVAVEEEADPLRLVLPAVAVTNVHDLLATPRDALAEAVVTSATTERVDRAVARARDVAGEVAKVVARAMNALANEGLREPDDLRDEEVRAKLAEAVRSRLAREHIEADPEAITEAIRTMEG